MGKWLVKNGIILTILSVIVAISSCLKEVVFAAYFGVSDVADAYTVAIMLPETLFSVVWTAMNTVLIPMYQDKLQNDTRKNATRFISIFFTAIFFICIGFVLFSEVIADLWIYLFAPGFSDGTHALAVKIARWIFPILIFEGIERVCIGIMQTHKKFILSKMLVMVRNSFIIIFLLLFANEFGVFAAAYGLLTGVIIEAALSLVGGNKFERIRIIFDFKDASIKRAGLLAIPVIIGTGVNELNIFTDKMIASFLPAGNLAALSYASRIEIIITTVILMNVVSLVFPIFAEYVAKKNISDLKKIYNQTIGVIIIFCIPIIVGGFVLGKDIITVAFMRGSFDAEAVKLVTPIFCVYLTAALFNTIRTTSVNVFASYGETKQIMKTSILAVIINIILNIILSNYWEAVGLAAASLLSAVFASTRLMLLIHKNKFQIEYNETVRTSVKCITAAIIMGIVLSIVKSLMDNGLFHKNFVLYICELLILVSIGAVLYFVILYIFKVKEMKEITKWIKNKR